MTLKLWSPIYWPAQFLLLLLWLLTYLPFSWQLNIGRALGCLLKWVLKSRRHIVRRNLAACFPELNHQVREQLFHDTFASLGMGFMEANFAWHGSQRRFLKVLSFDLQGYENFEKISGLGRGVIFLSAHLVVLELMARYFSQDHSFAAVYRKQKKAVFEQIITGGRNRYIHHLIDRTDLRGIIKWLRDGEMLWYAPDQDFGPKRSVS